MAQQINFNFFSEDALIASESQVTQDQMKRAHESQKELLSLSAMLDEMKSAIEGAKTGQGSDTEGKVVSLHSHLADAATAGGPLGSSGPSNGGSNPVQSPSEKEIAAALAALQGTLSALKSEMATSQSESVKSALEVEASSIQNAINSLERAQKIEQGIQDLENYINSLSPQEQQEWKEGTVTTWTFHGWWIFGYYTKNVTDYRQVIGQAIAAYLQAKFGINISGMDFDKYATLGDFLDAVETMVYGNAMQSMSEALFGFNNPAISMIQKLLESGAISTSQAQAMLQAIMEQMLQMLTLMAKANAGAQPGEGPSNTMVASMMSMMNEAVSQLQADLAKASNDKSGQSTQVSQAFIKQTQANLQKAVDQYNKIYHQEHDHSFWSIFLKVITIVISVIVIAVACCTGQFEIAAMMAVFLVLQQTGAMDKLAGAISEGLEALGVPPDVAKVLADVIIVVAMVLLTLGAGAASGAAAATGEAASAATSAATDAVAETASTAMEDGIEMIQMGSQTAIESAAEETVATTASETSETAASEATAEATGTSTSEATAETTTTQATEETSTQTSNALKRAFQKVVEKFNSFSKTTNMAIFAGTQTAMSTNLFQDSAIAIADATHMSEKQKEALEIAMEVIGSLVCMILGGLSMNGIASNVSRTTTVAQTIAKNLGPNFLKYFAIGTAVGGGALELGAGSKKAAIEFELSDSEKELGKDQAAVNLLQNYEKMIDQLMKSGNQYYTSTLKQEGEVQSTVLQEEFAAEAAFAQILSQSV